MSAPKFEAWPSISRLNRNVQITEKIDGINTAVLIEHRAVGEFDPSALNGWTSVVLGEDGEFYLVAAQSRKRTITPDDDNFGFAKWVQNNAPDLVAALGPGRHFGEWWGSGIQRGYGLTNGEKRFSLFNVNRYADVDFSGLPGVGLVPTLFEGAYSDYNIDLALEYLRVKGSSAEPGFMNPEGIIVFHMASRTPFKVTLENDEVPKSKVKNG